MDLKYKLSIDPNDYRPLYIKCYRCYEKGHIVTRCPFFNEIKGNMKPGKNNKEVEDKNQNQSNSNKENSDQSY